MSDRLYLNEVRKSLNKLQESMLALKKLTKPGGPEPTADYKRVWEAIERLDYLETNFGHQADLDALYPDDEEPQLERVCFGTGCKRRIPRNETLCMGCQCENRF